VSFVVLGASAGLGRALSEQLAARGHDLVLVATDVRDLEVEISHLRITYGIAAEMLAADASASLPFEELEQTVARLDRLDGVLFPIGASDEADNGLLAGEGLHRLLAANLEIVLDLSARFLPALLRQRHGSIVAFGSIAAVRGRGQNAAYAAAKRGLRSYFESLSCITRGTGVEAQLYQLGYLATQQTFGRRLFPPPASPRRIAEQVVSRLGTGSRIEYLPYYWMPLARGLRLLPERIFCRLVH
jgi:short-subunit dehydrogenase